MKEEKEHYGMFLLMLRSFDPVQYQEYQAHINTVLPPIKLQTYEPSYNTQLILNNIREDIKGEFEAVILYEELLTQLPYQELKNTLYSIIRTEKEHSEHLTKLLISIDSDQYNGLT
jgi:rubrerythrin